MSRSAFGPTAGLVLSALLFVAGCGPDAFAPPPSPELSQIPSSATAPPALSVELILADPGGMWRSALQEGVRGEAAKAKVLFNASVAGAPGKPSRQSELVRDAAGRGISAMLVEPGDDPDLAAALAEARGKGAAVVLLWKPLTGTVAGEGSAQRPPVVRFGPFENVARLLAGAVVEDVKASKLPADGRFLIAEGVPGAPDARELTAAVTKALGAAGVKEVKTLPITVTKDTDVQATFATAAHAIDADPKVTAVIGIDEEGTNAALGSLEKVKPGRKYAMGAVASLDRELTPAAKFSFAALADRNYSRLARKAIELAAAQARGEAVAAETKVPLDYHPRSKAATTLKAQGVDTKAFEKALEPNTDAIPTLPGASGLSDKGPRPEAGKAAEKKKAGGGSP
jgi:ABC-type sugar transport system substrate-binding protein